MNWHSAPTLEVRCFRAERSSLPHTPTSRTTLTPRRSALSASHEPALQHVAFATGFRCGEQREHPLVGGQPERGLLDGQRPHPAARPSHRAFWDSVPPCLSSTDARRPRPALGTEFAWARDLNRLTSSWASFRQTFGTEAAHILCHALRSPARRTVVSRKIRNARANFES